MTDAFFTVHQDLPREGPGEPADVDWAMGLLRPAPDATILDAGSGPGGDITPLLAHVPRGRVVAVDTHAPFIEAVRARFDGDGRVDAQVVSMTALPGPFDVIWSAGALYFLGGAAALDQLRPMLAPGGGVAFSEPCYFSDNPSAEARDLWEGEGAIVRSRDELLALTRQAGLEVLGDRPLAASAWEAYYKPMEARIAKLRPGAGADLAAELDAAEAEIAGWRATQHETGYLLIAARMV